MKETSIYIHIPFCDHKCIYCDFYSITNHKKIESYFNCLEKEIEFYSKSYSADRKIISIFFGGGTPSYVHEDYILRILDKINSEFLVSDNSEITIECNPGTSNETKLKSYLEFGINRISIGVQSFDNDELNFLTRIHDSETAKENIVLAKKVGFDNISLDLIFNLPNQTKERWLTNLEIAVKLPVKHISAYSLILERGTILNKMVLDGKVKLQDSDYDADLYETTIDYLADNRFKQYEVSNFSRPGFECKHNMSYWDYSDYLSFGTSAHSFINGKRWKNYSGLSFYIESVELKNHAKISKETLTLDQQRSEFVMLALRSSGLDLIELENKFGYEWENVNRNFLKTLENNNFISINNNFIKFTKCGYLICDEILSKLS